MNDVPTVTNIYGETIEGIKVSNDFIYRCCDIYEDSWGERHVVRRRNIKHKRHAFENGTNTTYLRFDEEECKERGVPQYVLNQRGAYRS